MSITVEHPFEQGQMYTFPDGVDETIAKEFLTTVYHLQKQEERAARPYGSIVPGLYFDDQTGKFVDVKEDGSHEEVTI